MARKFPYSSSWLPCSLSWKVLHGSLLPFASLKKWWFLVNLVRMKGWMLFQVCIPFKACGKFSIYQVWIPFKACEKFSIYLVYIFFFQTYLYIYIYIYKRTVYIYIFAPCIYRLYVYIHVLFVDLIDSLCGKTNHLSHLCLLFSLHLTFGSYISITEFASSFFFILNLS